jgi:Family of unknown function (DUF5723)
MRTVTIGLSAAILLTSTQLAFGQTLDARRMGMGGVVLAGQPDNVAYRAVPPSPGRSSGFTLPIGLLNLADDPPEFDPDSPGFNVFEIAELALNPPWHLQLNEPDPPSTDIVVSLGRDYLSVDLGEVGDYFEDGSHIASSYSLTPGAVSIGPVFGSLALLTTYENQFELGPELQQALNSGQFQPSTQYTLTDIGEGHVVATADLGCAMPLLPGAGEQATRVYGGARVRLFRGLGYGDMRTDAGFATEDTMFASIPAEFDVVGTFRDAGPSGGGWGMGLDLGTVVQWNGFEFGASVQNLGATMTWRVREQTVTADSTGNYEMTTVADNIHHVSRVPINVTGHVGRALGAWFLAADVTHSMDATQAHLGVERWIGWFALRGGMRLDEEANIQGGTGLGARFGVIGADLALATHNRHLNGERGLELAAGVSWYPK